MRLFIFLLFITLALSCQKQKEEFVKLRLSNETKYDFSNVSSNGTNFGNIKKKSKSHYHKFPKIRNYPDITFYLGKQAFKTEEANFNYFQLQTFQTSGKYRIDVLQIVPERGLFFATLAVDEKL
jgi:hypothetical protein